MESFYEKVITLKLSESQAAWLKSVMQNPLFTDNPNLEDPKHAEMRCQLFNAIDRLGVKSL